MTEDHLGEVDHSRDKHRLRSCVQVEGDPTEKDAMKIGKNPVNRYTRYAIGQFERGERTIRMTALGTAVGSCVRVAEIVKARMNNVLYQETVLRAVTYLEIWDPLEEGLDVVEHVRRMSSLTITLSLDPLDPTRPGYQPPKGLPEAPQPRPPLQPWHAPPPPQHFPHGPPVGMYRPGPRPPYPPVPLDPTRPAFQPPLASRAPPPPTPMPTPMQGGQTGKDQGMDHRASPQPPFNDQPMERRPSAQPAMHREAAEDRREGAAGNHPHRSAPLQQASKPLGQRHVESGGRREAGRETGGRGRGGEGAESGPPVISVTLPQPPVMRAQVPFVAPSMDKAPQGEGPQDEEGRGKAVGARGKGPKGGQVGRGGSERRSPGPESGASSDALIDTHLIEAHDGAVGNENGVVGAKQEEGRRPQATGGVEVGGEGLGRRGQRGGMRRQRGGRPSPSPFPSDPPHEPKATSHDPKTPSHNPKAVSHEPKAASHESKTASPQTQAPKDIAPPAPQTPTSASVGLTPVSTPVSPPVSAPAVSANPAPKPKPPRKAKILQPPPPPAPQPPTSTEERPSEEPHEEAGVEGRGGARRGRGGKTRGRGGRGVSQRDPAVTVTVTPPNTPAGVETADALGKSQSGESSRMAKATQTDPEATSTVLEKEKAGKEAGGPTSDGAEAEGGGAGARGEGEARRGRGNKGKKKGGAKGTNTQAAQESQGSQQQVSQVSQVSQESQPQGSQQQGSQPEQQPEQAGGKRKGGAKGGRGRGEGAAEGTQAAPQAMSQMSQGSQPKVSQPKVSQQQGSQADKPGPKREAAEGGKQGQGGKG